MIGRTVSHYRIVAELGAGGMGRVYRAEHVLLGKPAAVKFLAPDLCRDPEAKARFLVEARAVFALDHPNICPVYDAGETDDGLLFICMAYCEGETLRQRLARGALPEAEAVAIARQIAAGLAGAHAAGIVHRDVKPANIMLGRGTGARLLDFGLARLLAESRVTRRPVTLGTAAYMSPEQVRGGEVDQRSDLWSLGACLYEMLAGRPPFAGEHDEAVFWEITSLDPPPLPRALAHRPVSRIVRRCLAKDPRDRYQSARELEEELAGWRVGLRKRLPEGARRVARRARAHPRVLGGAVAALLLAGAGLLLWRAEARRAGGAVAAPQLVAVLPDATVDSLDAGLRDGLVADLADQLDRLASLDPRVWVVPPAYVAERKVTNPLAARSRLGAGLTLTVSVRRLDPQGRACRLALAARGVDDAGAWTATGGPSARELAATVSDLATWQSDVALAAGEMVGLRLPPSARARLEQGGTRVPGSYRDYLLGLGFLSPSAGRVARPDSAAAWLARAVAADSSFARGLAALAAAQLALAARGDTTFLEPAALGARRALALEEGLAGAQATLGRVAQRRGDATAAVARLEAALRCEPPDREAVLDLAAARDAAGDTTGAERVLQEAIRRQPGWGQYQAMLGYHHVRRQRYGLAIAPYRRAIALAPGWYRNYSSLGGICMLVDSLALARPLLETSLALEPEQGANFYSNLGNLNYYEGRFDEAAAMFRRAVEKAPRDYRYRGWLAHALYWVPGERAASLPHFRAAAAAAAARLAAAPDDAGLLSDLADFSAMQEDTAGARAYLRRLLAAAPSPDGALMYRIACVQEHLGERDRALDWIARARQAGASRLYIERYPDLRNLRADRRYLATVAGRPD